MAETIVEEGKLKCQGTITKGGLAGKECRRAVLVNDPVLGWGIPCDRCPKFHPLRKILRDLVESGELDKEEILAVISDKKGNGREEVDKNSAIRLPRGIGGKPKEALELAYRLEKAREKILEKLFKKYFIKAFTRDGKCYNQAMKNEAYEIFSIGYRKPLKVSLEAFEIGKYGEEFMISGKAFWGDPEKEKDLPSWKRSESEKFEWISIYSEEDVVAYAQQAMKFFTDLGIDVSLKVEL